MRGAGAAFVDFGGTQIESVDRVPDEVDHVIFGDPFPQVGREQQGGVVVDMNELGCHLEACIDFTRSIPKSDRLLAVGSTLRSCGSLLSAFQEWF